MSNEKVNVLEEVDEINPKVMKALRSLSVSGTAGYDELSGMEGMFHGVVLKLKDVTGLAGKKAYSLGSWVGGMAVKEIREGFAKANRQVQLSFGSNGHAIGKLWNDLADNEAKANVAISVDTIKAITSTGQLKDLPGDITDLIKTLELVKTHENDIDAYLEKRLALMKTLVTADTNESVATALTSLETLTAPTLKFPHKPEQGRYVSDVLPGGKVLVFVEDDKGHQYSMSGDKPSADSSPNPFSSSEWRDMLKKLEQVNEFHKSFVKAGESYVKFIQRWGDTVKALSVSLEKKPNVSSSFKRDIERLMTGDKTYLLFYSGFMPRVTGYTNAFIADVMTLVTKLI